MLLSNRFLDMNMRSDTYVPKFLAKMFDDVLERQNRQNRHYPLLQNTPAPKNFMPSFINTTTPWKGKCNNSYAGLIP